MKDYPALRDFLEKQGYTKFINPEETNIVGFTKTDFDGIDIEIYVYKRKDDSFSIVNFKIHIGSVGIYSKQDLTEFTIKLNQKYELLEEDIKKIRDWRKEDEKESS